MSNGVPSHGKFESIEEELTPYNQNRVYFGPRPSKRAWPKPSMFPGKKDPHILFQHES